MNATELRLLRLESQGLFRPAASLIEGVTRPLGIQCQQPRQAEINLALRSTIERTELQQAYQSGEVVRSWAQRWTHHLLTKRDWQLVLSARQAEKLPNNYFDGQKQAVLALVSLLQEYLTEHPSLTKAETEKFLRAHAPVELTHQSIYGVLQLVMSRGHAYFDAGSSTSKYVLRAATPALVDSQTALAELITRYVDAFGPVTMHDFTKWLGVRTELVRPIWQRLQLNWTSVTVQGQQLLMTKPVTQAHLAELAELSQQQVTLTGGFAAAMTGYENKDWLVAPVNQAQLWSTNGILNPLVITAGNVLGTWKCLIKGKKITANFYLWEKLTQEQQTQVAEQIERVATFLDKKVAAINYL